MICNSFGRRREVRVLNLHATTGSYFFFLREFQPMASAPDDSSLSSDQDTNQFLVEAGIESQISYTTIRDFTSWANWNPPLNGLLDRYIYKYIYISFFWIVTTYNSNSFPSKILCTLCMGRYHLSYKTLIIYSCVCMCVCVSIYIMKAFFFFDYLKIKMFPRKCSCLFTTLL